MKLFIDSSALVKFFHKEEGSQRVTELIVSEDNEIWISEIAGVEFLSAVTRRFRNKEIDEENLNNAISGFEEQLSTFNVEPVGHAIIKETESLIKQHGKSQGLRTLDALHLGTFNLIAEKDWVFVAADETLCKAVHQMGYSFINPLEDQRQ
ncbi:MAG: type II toxin-antitoxin system VapC family toxin [bacterium]